MALKRDERWYVVPPGPLAPHLLTIRTKDGSYREPTAGEVEALKQMPAALEEALEIARTALSAAADTYNVDEDVEKCRRLAELLAR